jgi:hypothetical protein
MGSSRIENFYAKDLDSWFKKDFVEHVTRQINGEIEVIGDSRKWTQIGGALCLESTKKKDTGMKMIGKVLENKEEYKKVNKFNIKRYLDSMSEDASRTLKEDVLAMVKKDLFNPDMDRNTAFYKSMIKAKLNQIVSERIRDQESIKPKLKVAV